MQDSSHTHREIVAAVASLKSCLRSVILSVSPPPAAAASNPTTTSDSKIQGSVQRANDAVNKLEGLLSAVADQTLRLPLETSKRLVDVGLPDLLQQLLNACQLNAAWPAPTQATSDAGTAAQVAGSTLEPAAAAETGSNAGLAATAAAIAPAALHPSWAAIQQLLQAVFSTLSVLTAVLIRACTRSHDPAIVLMQLASPAVMEAQVAYLQQLRQHAGHLQNTAEADPLAASLAAVSLQYAPSCVAAFSSIYGLLAAATDAQAGLQELRQQLITSLCSTQLLPVAADLLLLVPALMQPEQQQAAEVQANCQAAGWSLLTLSLFVSGAGISICPVNINPALVQPGQPLPSSMMAASIRADADEQAQPLDLSAAFSSAAEPSAATLQEQLLAQPVLSLLQERLYHCVTELRGSYGASSTAFAQKQKLLREAGSAHQLLLLPGRCCPADQDVLHAALRALRCWRALLMSPAASSLPLISGFGVQLLLTLLAGVLAEPIRAGSGEREALRGRVIRVAVHCLQLMCTRLDQELLFQHLPALTAALAGVVSSAGAYWDSNKRAVKSEALPYTGQVRCVDKSTGDMMVRYTMAAQSALDLLRQLLTTCRAYAAVPVGDAEAGGVRVAEVMLGAGALPALEQLFRQLPVVSPAHVTAATFLVELMPLCLNSDLSAGQLPLLATLRKFITKSVGIMEPDREAALIATTQFAALLGALAAAYANGLTATAAGGNADTLLQHAAVQLLPSLQAFVSADLKTPIPAPYSATLSTCMVAATAAALSSSGTAAEPARTHLLPAMLSTYQQLALLACTAPHLQLGATMLASQALPTVAEILSSSYWMLPGFQAAAGVMSSAGRVSPAVQGLGARVSSSGAAGAGLNVSGAMFTGEHAVHLALQTIEGLVASTAAVPKRASDAGQVSKGMTGSCSTDCLCAVRRSGGGDGCQIGNAKCGMDGWCCCSSPKACSDITPPGTPQVVSDDERLTAPAHADSSRVFAFGAAGSAAGAAAMQQELPGEQQLLLVLSRLMQSKLLPELLRAVQQLPGATLDGVISPKPGDSAAGSFLGGFSRPASANGLTVNVPIRRGSLQRDARGIASPGGVSPRAYSPHGHSAPATAALASTLRSQTSATQSFLSAYMGDMPATALGAGGNSNTILGAGLKVTTNATSRFASSGYGATGTSPRADDGAYGLLRAGSSGSSIAWTAGASLLQEAGVRVVARDNSSGFGSSPSLASPLAASCGDSISPFVLTQHDAAGGGAAGVMAGADSSSTSQLQHRLESLLLIVAQATLAVADAGMLGAELLQRRPSGASAGGDSDNGVVGVATPVDGHTAAGVRKPALFSTASGPAIGYSLLSAGVFKQLSSVTSGPGGLYNSYLQSTSGPRTSWSGSGPYGNISAEDVVAGIRSCLAAAGAAAVVPGSGVSAKEALGVGGSPIGAQQGSIPVGQLSPGAGGRQGSVQFSAGSPDAAAADGLSAEPSDVIFPVELGLSQLNITAPAGVDAGQAPVLATQVSAPAAPPCTPATPALLNALLRGDASAAGVKQAQGGLLPVDVLRRLQGALAAAGPLLARHSGPIETEVLCPQVLLAKLSPRPVGCWNASCTNMPGTTEAGVASKPCTSCKVAAFCSKACEKKAWSEHTMACSRLAALAAAGMDGSA